MSFKQFKIYNKVYTPDYKDTGRKSYGSNSFTSTDIVIGSSKVNSFDFVSHETKTFIKENGVRVFQFFVDGELIKEALYNEKTKEITSKSKFVFNSANCEIVEKRNFRDNDIQTDEEADKIDEKSLKEIKEGK